MKGIKLNIEQGSPEWHTKRLGVITGSKLGKCFTSKLAISKAGCDSLARELAGELVYKNNNELPSSFQSDAMIRGQHLEDEAKEIVRLAISQAEPDLKAESAGFFYNEEHNVGASPDMVFDDLGVEIKCPLPKNHIGYLMEWKTPDQYYAQVQLCMLLTGIEQWVFCSYYPGLKPLIYWQQYDMQFVSKIKEVIGVVNEKLDLYKKVIEL